MSSRFFSAAPIITDNVALDGAEAHHLLNVMRAKVGDVVTLFDDSGAEFDAEIAACRRSEVELHVRARREDNRELPFALVVGVSLPKGDRQKWLVEKLTELGATTLTPLITTRGVAQPTDSALERLHRSVIEAAKQCGRNRLMRIENPRSLGEFVDQAQLHREAQRLLAHPDGIPLSQLDRSAARPTLVTIGPEGGFTDEEVAMSVAARWQSVNLGPRILRVETAAVALAAVVALSARS